jgi:histidinol phosphatase-like PHP family hydrolase
MTKIDRDFHMHTDLSSCASREATMPRMVAAARESGLKYVGISDHFHELQRDFAEMARTNRRLIETEKQHANGVDLFLGCEAQMDAPNRCTISPQLAREFDYVLCSCNHYHLRQVENPTEKSPAGYARHYLQMVEGAIDTGFVDAIVHPFLHDKVNGTDIYAVLKA